MVSQFKSPHAVTLLGSLGYPFADGTHAIGRLDKESEGLLLLTTNKQVTSLLFQSTVPHNRTYLVQLKNPVNPFQLQLLLTGVDIPVQNGAMYFSKVTNACLVDRPAGLPDLPHQPFVPLDHCWLQLTLTEGKFHQVRKMMTAIENRCLRLIRRSIEDLTLDGLEPGQVKEITEVEFFYKLRIDIEE